MPPTGQQQQWRGRGHCPLAESPEAVPLTLGRRVEGRERGVGAWRAWKGGGESGLWGGSGEAVGLGVWFKSGDFEARHSYFRRILEKAIFGTRQKGSSSPKLSHRLLDADCGLRAGPGQTQESTPPAQPVSGTRTEVALWDTGEQQASHGEADGVPGAAPGSRGESRVATPTHPLPVCTPGVCRCRLSPSSQGPDTTPTPVPAPGWPLLAQDQTVRMVPSGRKDSAL